MSGYFDRSARSIESRWVVNYHNYGDNDNDDNDRHNNFGGDSYNQKNNNNTKDDIHSCNQYQPTWWLEESCIRTELCSK